MKIHSSFLFCFVFFKCSRMNCRVNSLVFKTLFCSICLIIYFYFSNFDPVLRHWTLFLSLLSTGIMSAWSALFSLFTGWCYNLKSIPVAQHENSKKWFQSKFPPSTGLDFHSPVHPFTPAHDKNIRQSLMPRCQVAEF